MKSHAGCYCALYCCLTPLQRHIQISQRQPVFVDLFISDRYNNLVLIKITVSDRPKNPTLRDKRADRLRFCLPNTSRCNVEKLEITMTQSVMCFQTVLNLTF